MCELVLPFSPWCCQVTIHEWMEWHPTRRVVLSGGARIESPCLSGSEEIAFSLCPMAHWCRPEPLKIVLSSSGSHWSQAPYQECIFLNSLKFNIRDHYVSCEVVKGEIDDFLCNLSLSLLRSLQIVLQIANENNIHDILKDFTILSMGRNIAGVYLLFNSIGTGSCTNPTST